MHKTSPHLDGAYAAFGKVIEGMEVVNRIAETATDYEDRPLEDQVMQTVTVDTFGVDYPEPEKLWGFSKKVLFGTVQHGFYKIFRFPDRSSNACFFFSSVALA